MSIISSHVTVQVNWDDIRQDLSTYLERVKSGETVVIVEAGKPLAEIRPVVSEPTPLRPFGLCAGEFVVPDDFDAPLPESIVQEFEGK
jgi:prevent-host-death family protein